MCVCRGVSPTSQMRMEIHMKRGHLLWKKKEETTKQIDLQMLFDDYWTSKKDKFTVTGQS